MGRKKKGSSGSASAPIASPEEKKHNINNQHQVNSSNKKKHSSERSKPEPDLRQSSGSLDSSDSHRRESIPFCSKLIQILIYLSIVVFFAFYLADAQDLLKETFGALGVNAPHELLNPNNTIAAELFLEQYPDKAMKYPVVFIPGIISSRLEIWQGFECVSSQFREKLWASPVMVQMVLLKKACWLQHMALNQSNWKDPDGIKVRSSSGLAAADYFIADYWIWGKLIANLARLGYDENSMYMASYDWRLPFKYLEERDRYFTKLKASIELSNEIHSRKAVLIAHSFGGSVLHYFLKWVESPNGANLPNWVENHIHSIIEIGIPWLGVPKSLATVLSGEMKDTADLNPLFGFLKDNFFTREEFFFFLRSMGSVANMLPKGGDRIWNHDTFGNNETWALKFSKETSSYKVYDKCEIIEEPITSDEKRSNVTKKERYTMDEAFQLARETFPNYMRLTESFTNFDIVNPASSLYDDQPKFWSNPLSSSLPRAPSMKIYNFYGINKPTERAYHYLATEDKCIPYYMNTSCTDEAQELLNGVQLTNGDGTVPLVSLGCVPRKVWKDKRYNPSGIPSIIREYKNVVKGVLGGGDFRGGPENSDHVDILGNTKLNLDILKIVSGAEEILENRILSNLDEVCNKLQLDIKPKGKTSK